MIIKLDTSVFRFARRAHSVKKEAVPLTNAQWIIADRIVITAMFIAIVIGAILF